ncbi:MAG: pyridoxamine 5'-phosphate oxidase family protein, partial [Desulfuromonadales bacterium]|nr:pyridoxamine 5'-phosphate oxidase family protein [Desulfuromonadales bacterium]
INGRAEVSTDPELLRPFEVSGKLPTTAIVVHVEEAYLHCPKALIRAELWDRASRFESGGFPTMTKMLSDQHGENLEGDALEQAEREYRSRIEKTLY